MKLGLNERLTVWLVAVILIACNDDEPQIDVCVPYVPQATDQYEYPIRPGMPEWGELNSYEEMLEVIKLPDSVIEVISTPGLVETCLDYPLLSRILAFEYLQIGMEQQMADFNGFQGLSKRSDAGTAMLHRYKYMRPECFPKMGTSVEQGRYILHIMYVEMIMSQPVFVEMLTDSERNAQVRQSLEKYDMMLKFPDQYALLSLYAQVYVIAQTMLVDGYLPFVQAIGDNELLNEFVRKAGFSPETALQDALSTLDLIVEIAKSYI